MSMLRAIYGATMPLYRKRKGGDKALTTEDGGERKASGERKRRERRKNSLHSLYS